MSAGGAPRLTALAAATEVSRARVATCQGPS
jgi:hypothetical protein